MDLKNVNSVYFIGIGGIGMSALARYFRHKGARVSGYDRAETPLTRTLSREGMQIIYSTGPEAYLPNVDLVVYTPAIPKDNPIFAWYQELGYPLYKRSEVLEEILRDMKSITVAGTHGKTTISNLIAHILRDSGYGCNAFLGGISANYDTNYWSSGDQNVAVVEADEYDRSFLKLQPDIAILTAIAADHLDIYGSEEELARAFLQYTKNIKPGGTLWHKLGVKHALEIQVPDRRKYSLQNSSADVYAKGVTMRKGGYVFDVQGKGWTIPGLHLDVGGMHNVENAVAAIAVAKQLEIDDESIKRAIANFKGVYRRFQYVVKTEEMVYIDDYAHHPDELETLIRSAKGLFPKKRCVVAFQPHLYSRTKDLAKAFARSLDQADEVLLLDIYPAREQPIEGVSAQTIADQMGNPNHTIMSKEGLLDYVRIAPLQLFITAGAGDIDRLVKPIEQEIEQRLGK